MTVKDVEDKVQQIERCAGDDEAAHGYEDSLHHDVLEAIAAGKGENPRELALAALQTRNIKFARWCA